MGYRVYTVVYRAYAKGYSVHAVIYRVYTVGNMPRCESRILAQREGRGASSNGKHYFTCQRNNKHGSS